jgi:hypothetical protein
MLAEAEAEHATLALVKMQVELVAEELAVNGIMTI